MAAINTDPTREVVKQHALLTRRPTVAVVALTVIVALSLVMPIHSDSLGAQTTVPPSSETKEAQEYAELVRKDRDAVQKEIDLIDAEIADAEQRLTTAEQHVAAARDAVAAAEAEVATAERHVEEAKAKVREYAIEAYIQPPDSASLWVLSISDADDAAYARELIQIISDDRAKVVDELVAAQVVADEKRAVATENAELAAKAVAAVEAEQSSLQAARDDQDRLARELDDRLDAALAEAEALAELDAELAEQIRQEELELRRQGPNTPPTEVAELAMAAPAPPQASTPPQNTTNPPPATTTTTPRPSPTTTTPRPSPTTTRPPATTTTLPSGGASWNDMRNVQGIWVHYSISGNLNNLLNAAKAAGHNLGGSGFRDPQRQIQLRRQNCGPTYYDIWERPSSQCNPPTARPGRSMHEQGLAVDFTIGGFTIKSRSHPAFVWLNANAARYGFYNLPSEPWHWSVNGN